MTDARQLHWLIIGAGVSGLGAAKFLRSRGLQVRVSERSRLADGDRRSFLDLGVDLQDGGHDPVHLNGVDQIVLSPGLPANHPLLLAASARQIPMVSEIDLALEHFKGVLLAVTGTNGKSTTCAMLGHGLNKLGLKSCVGGNFGDPPTAMLAEGRMQNHLVLELSSYQLEQSHRVAPEIAIFTSFSFDHLARHGSLRNYLAAKWRVFDQLSASGLAILPYAVARLAEQEGLAIPKNSLLICQNHAELAACAENALGHFHNELVFKDGSKISLRAIAEVHNQLNAIFTVLSLAHLTRRPPQDLLPLLDDFKGLPHRCELVGRRRGHPIINDSKSTNLESTLVALMSQPRPVVLMMGGQGKGEPYEPLLQEKAKIAALITFGASGSEIAGAVRSHLPLFEFSTCSAALAAIGGILERYDAGLLFSPGCASFDEFKNYGHRGEFFRQQMAPYLT